MKPTIKNKRYYLDEIKQVVTCVIDWEFPDVNHVYNLESFPKKSSLCTYGYITKSFQSIGKSKCVEGDKFDIELGRKLAHKRALAKVYKRMAGCLDEIHKKLNKIDSEIYDTAWEYGMSSRQILIDCDELINQYEQKQR